MDCLGRLAESSYHRQVGGGNEGEVGRWPRSRLTSKFRGILELERPALGKKVARWVGTLTQLKLKVKLEGVDLIPVVSRGLRQQRSWRGYGRGLGVQIQRLSPPVPWAVGAGREHTPCLLIGRCGRQLPIWAISLPPPGKHSSLHAFLELGACQVASSGRLCPFYRGRN